MSAMTTGASTSSPSTTRYWTSTCSDRSMEPTSATSLGSRRRTSTTTARARLPELEAFEVALAPPLVGEGEEADGALAVEEPGEAGDHATLVVVVAGGAVGGVAEAGEARRVVVDLPHPRL